MEFLKAVDRAAGKVIKFLLLLSIMFFFFFVSVGLTAHFYPIVGIAAVTWLLIGVVTILMMFAVIFEYKPATDFFFGK